MAQAKFQKGDRIRLIKEDANHEIGALGTIDENNSDIPWAIFDDTKRRYVINQNSAELATGTATCGDDDIHEGDVIEFLDSQYFAEGDISEKFIRHGYAPEKGIKGKVEWIEGDYFVVSYTRSGSDTQLGFKRKSLKLVQSNYKKAANTPVKNMIDNLKTFFKNLGVTEPEKSRRAADITDDQGDLTSQGKDLFIAYLLTKNEADFDTTVVQPILAAKKALKDNA